MFLFQEAASAAPEQPWMHDPKFWLLAGTAAVTLILWFARLEFKTNANEKRLGEQEVEFSEAFKESKGERTAIKKDLYAHTGDTKIHHNAEMFDEFKKGIDMRFGQLTESVRDMKSSTQQSFQDLGRKLDHLADRD